MDNMGECQKKMGVRLGSETLRDHTRLGGSPAGHQTAGKKMQYVIRETATVAPMTRASLPRVRRRQFFPAHNQLAVKMETRWAPTQTQTNGRELGQAIKEIEDTQEEL